MSITDWRMSIGIAGEGVVTTLFCITVFIFLLLSSFWIAIPSGLWRQERSARNRGVSGLLFFLVSIGLLFLCVLLLLFPLQRPRKLILVSRWRIDDATIGNRLNEWRDTRVISDEWVDVGGVVNSVLNELPSDFSSKTSLEQQEYGRKIMSEFRRVGYHLDAIRSPVNLLSGNATPEIAGSRLDLPNWFVQSIELSILKAMLEDTNISEYLYFVDDSSLEQPNWDLYENHLNASSSRFKMSSGAVQTIREFDDEIHLIGISDAAIDNQDLSIDVVLLANTDTVSSDWHLDVDGTTFELKPTEIKRGFFEKVIRLTFTNPATPLPGDITVHLKKKEGGNWIAKGNTTVANFSSAAKILVDRTSLGFVVSLVESVPPLLKSRLESLRIRLGNIGSTYPTSDPPPNILVGLEGFLDPSESYIQWKTEARGSRLLLKPNPFQSNVPDLKEWKGLATRVRPRLLLEGSASPGGTVAGLSPSDLVFGKGYHKEYQNYASNFESLQYEISNFYRSEGDYSRDILCPYGGAVALNGSPLEYGFAQHLEHTEEFEAVFLTLLQVSRLLHRANLGFIGNSSDIAGMGPATKVPMFLLDRDAALRYRGVRFANALCWGLFGLISYTLVVYRQKFSSLSSTKP